MSIPDNTTPPRMNPAIKAQWIADLRSGRFVQGQRLLHNSANNTYCCLGVLAAQAVEAGVVKEIYGSFCGVSDKPKGADRVVLHFDILRWAELPQDTAPSGNINLPKPLSAGLLTLTACNDHGNMDFNAIADIIEAQL